MLLIRTGSAKHNIYLCNLAIRKGYRLAYSKGLLNEKVCRKGEIDIAILDELFRAGEGGILPKDIALNLKEYELDRWQVLHRIQCINRRLDEEIAKKVAEKRGHKWALTNFVYKAWKQTEGELEE